MSILKTNYTKRFYEIVRELVKYTYYKDGVFLIRSFLQLYSLLISSQRGEVHKIIVECHEFVIFLRYTMVNNFKMKVTIMTLLDVQHVQKVYQTRFGATEVTALKDISFSVEEGEYVAVMGESGSGKTTLLNILATLDRPTEGKVLLNGEDIQKISDKVLTEFRRDHLGFVFQDFNLLETLSVYDNMVLPLVLARRPIEEMEKKVKPIAEMLGIEDLLKKYPYELSGGQQQRVAIGRAMITDPSLLLADEPTGALDSKSASNTLDLFDKINENGQTILMVTHSTVAAGRAKRVLFIKDGLIYNQLYRGDRTDQQMFELISETLTVMANRGEAHV